MQRKLKNIIMIILIIILSVTIYFTIQQAQNNNSIVNPMPQNMGNMSMEERLEMPSGENGQMRQPNGFREMPEVVQGTRNMQEIRNTSVSTKYYVMIGLESFGIAIIITYLLMSQFNKKGIRETFKNGDKVIIFILATSMITATIAMPCVYFMRQDKSINEMVVPEKQEETKEEETGEKEKEVENVDPGETVTDKEIDFSKYDSNITITEAGEYTLTGESNHSVLVNADGDVILNLEGITINSTTTAAIANISQKGLTLNIKPSTTNTLSDGGLSEYDGCIFSYGPLTIKGSGKLNVYGKQEDGEGIATKSNTITINGGNINIECNDDGINTGGDGGTITINDGNVYIKASGDGIDSNKNVIINGGTVYTMGSARGGDSGIDADEGTIINGGTVIALGSDMLEEPLPTSKQNTVCFELKTAIESGTTVTLKDAKNEIIAIFEANENFKTLIFSNDLLNKGNYYLYVNEEVIGESKI